MKRPIDGNALASLLRTRRALEGNPNAQDAFEVAMWDAVNAEEVTLNDLRDAVYEDAVAHGLWEDEYCDGLDWYQESHSMIECEVDELYDAIEDRLNGHGDEHFSEELADVIIMSLSVAGKLGIDIDAAVKRKMAINKDRSWKHEGEKRG